MNDFPKTKHIPTHTHVYTHHFFSNGVSYSPGCFHTYVAQQSELLILLTPPSECWDYRWDPLQPGYKRLGLELRCFRHAKQALQRYTLSPKLLHFHFFRQSGYQPSVRLRLTSDSRSYRQNSVLLSKLGRLLTKQLISHGGKENFATGLHMEILLRAETWVGHMHNPGIAKLGQ